MGGSAVRVASVSDAVVTQLIPLDAILLPRNVPEGMNTRTLKHWRGQMQAGAEHPPIVVRPYLPGVWALIDGRHRMIAAVMVGRSHIAAYVE